MKKFTLAALKISFIFTILVIGQRSFGQIIFQSEPDSIAVLDEMYSYTPDVAYAPDAPTFTLEESPEWMDIVPSTGEITGTPTSMSDGGFVSVKAHNGAGDYYQSFYVYISDEVICDPNIVAYWPLDNKTGTSLPDVVNGHDARWRGTVEPVPTLETDAMAGKSLLFAPLVEDDEFYSVADQEPFQFQYQDDFSVSFWFKNESSLVNPLRNEVMIGRGQSGGARWTIKYIFASGKIEFYLQDGSTDHDLILSTPTITDNNWHHVVAAFDGRHVAPDFNQDSYFWLWVDKSISSGTFDFYTENFFCNGELTLGWSEVTNEPYSGYLDEVVYYNKALNSTEVTELYDRGMAGQSVCSSGNNAPIITSVPVTEATEDEEYSYQLEYREIDQDVITFTAPVKEAWMDFNTSTGELSFTPLEEHAGDHDVTLGVSDGSATVLQSFTISVTAVNDAPVFTSTPPLTGEANQMYDYFVTATDEEEQTLTLTCPTKPGWLSFSSSGGNGHLYGEPSSGGSYDVVLSVTDGTNVTTQPFTIVVSGPSPVIEIVSTLAKVYPVPASDFVQFDFEETIQEGSLKIFSMDGKLVLDIDLQNVKSYILDLNGLNAKEYIYNIISNSIEQKGKILIK